MQMFGAPSLADSGKSRAQLFIRRWAIKEREAQSAQVKAGPAYEQSRIAASFYLFYLFNCRSRPIRGGEIYRWRDEVDQVMRHPLPLSDGHFGGSYLNALIDLDRVAIDDLTADTARQFDSQIAFSGSGRTNYGNDRSADILSAFVRLVLCVD